MADDANEKPHSALYFDATYAGEEQATSAAASLEPTDEEVWIWDRADTRRYFVGGGGVDQNQKSLEFPGEMLIIRCALSFFGGSA
jgi:hypothetical protein